MSVYKLTIKQSNPRVLALLNLIRQTDEVELSEEINDIPQWQQNIVQDRMQSTPKTDYYSQEEFEKKISG
jgi:D-ribose pyranose/furanose isomerase RbsD